jgi:hypothetical protein
MNIDRLIELLYKGLNDMGGGNDIQREATHDAVTIVIDALKALNEEQGDGH